MRAAREARPVHSVRLPRQNRLQKRQKLTRIVLHIRVLNDDDIACRMLEAASKRRTLSLVLLVEDEGVDERALQLGQHVPRAIRRPVVDGDDLEPQGYVPHAPQ